MTATTTAKLTPLQRQIVALTAEKPLLLRTRAICRDLITARALYKHVGLHYIGSGSKILFWNPAVTPHLRAAVNALGTDAHIGLDCHERDRESFNTAVTSL